MMAAPTVSVLMTYYNKGSFVEEAVRSVLAQTFADLELLIIDDGSTDDGLKKIRNIGDPRIRIERSDENLGRPAAAKHGFDMARGEFVAVLDADDLMHPERLELQVTAMRADPALGACGSYARYFGREEKIGRWPLTDEECRGRMLFDGPLLYGTGMYRLSVLNKHRLRPDPQWRTPGMDQLFVQRLAVHTKVANLALPLTEYRIGEQNMKEGRDLLADRMKMMYETLRILGLPQDRDAARALVILEGRFPSELSASDVRLVRRTIKRSADVVGPGHPLHRGSFKAELERRWALLYFTLLDHAPLAGWTYFLLSAERPMDRVRMLIGRTVHHFLGRMKTPKKEAASP